MRRRKRTVTGLGASVGRQGARLLRLMAETRTYLVDEADLSKWLTGGTAFYVTAVNVLVPESEGPVDIEFVVSTGQRSRGVKPAVQETEKPGPVVSDDPDDLAGEPVGTADPVPMIAAPGERKRLKSMRELRLEAQKAGRPEPVTHITERTAEEDDPVPSAIPR